MIERHLDDHYPAIGNQQHEKNTRLGRKLEILGSRISGVSDSAFTFPFCMYVVVIWDASHT